ncbi:hypothetical protein NP233_g11705 [Leucocoprinus birnbaumii]|uniref:Association with the SNF1 complex (ASC) domain-containing protein n=1 Tax=Leucocoprinus birnbaumii TaxID=56174 RepID=A0AAD5VJK7_9AGAR|nr:hypothetical protein NP233_g11705 [Leucocoprinus birnbaumii]
MIGMAGSLWSESAYFENYFGLSFTFIRDPNSNVWTATIHLLPGTHHVRFLVDDQWRVSDELPTAVDDSGSLANYVNVQPGTPPSTASPLPPITPSPTPAAPPPAPTPARPPIPGQSFWSTNSSVDDEEPNKPSTHSLHVQISSAKWTSVLPEALIEAAREEELYLQASAGHYDSQSRSTHVSGFVPAPNIPPATGMPRHLDKLILNTKMTVPGSGSNNGNNGGGSGQGSPSRIGSGQGGGRENRDRDRDRDRERERDRTRREGRERKRESRREEKREREQRKEREREQQLRQQEQQALSSTVVPNPSLANFPPAPPPSEDGSGAGLDEKPEHSPVRGGVDVADDTPSATGEGETEGTRQEQSGNTTAITTPNSTTPEGATTTSTTTTTTPNPTAIATTALRPSVSVTAPQTATPTKPSSSSAPAPTMAGSGRISGSRAITLDMESLPALTDDNSVLPVPSHVVLQHLCTSAIRNGVLAVATTTRYRKKVNFLRVCGFMVRMLTFGFFSI